MSKLSSVIQEVKSEYLSAVEEHGDIASFHEGYAVLLEEMDELWDEIKLKNKNLLKIYAEAKQVAAMAVKIMMKVDK